MNTLIAAEGRYPDFAGGAETLIHHVAHELVARGHEVHTLTRKPRRGLPAYEFEAGDHVHRYAGPPAGSRLHWLFPATSFWGARSGWISLSRQVETSAIVFNQPFPTLGVLSAGPARSNRKVYIFHSASHLEMRSALRKNGTFSAAGLALPMLCVSLAERCALRKCDAIVTLSRYMRGRVVRFHSESPDRVTVIPGGVDGELFSPLRNPDARGPLRERFDVPRSAFVIFAAKRLYSAMGLENLIRAVRLLDDRHLRLLLAGDGPLREKLQRMASLEGVEDRVQFLGNVPYEQMPLYYRMADLFVSTHPEAFGLATLEALACGVPVMSVPGGAAPEILEGLCGNLLFKHASPEAMAGHIQRYREAPAEFDDVRKRCRGYVLTNYSWKLFALSLESLLRPRPDGAAARIGPRI